MFWTNADAKSAIIVALLAAFYFSPILQSSLADADGYLRHVSAIAGFDRVTAMTVYAEIATHYRALQPGCFPLGPLPLAIWLADPTEKVVKICQLALIALTFGTFAVLARRLFGSVSAAVLAAVTAFASWELRVPHDPVIGTSFVTTILAELVLLSCIAWLTYRSSRRPAWLIVSCTTSVLMMLTDPLGLGFALLLAILTIFQKDLSGLRFVWIAAVVAVMLVTGVLAAPNLPWQRVAYGHDVVAQVIAPLPATYRQFGSLHIGGTAGFSHGSAYVDDRFINVPAADGWSWLQMFACTLAAFVSISTVGRTSETRPPLTALWLGFGLWLIPAVLLGRPGIWHDGMALGQAFDGVYLQYFGIALLVTSGVVRLREGTGSFAIVLPSLVALAVFALCYGNVRANALAIIKTQRYASSIALIERAGAAGFFSFLPAGRTLAVSSSEPFASGIHFSPSDAKYAIYHFSKQRYHVVSIDSLRRTPALDAWLLQTSRTSGIFVSLAHISGFAGAKVLADRGLGFSSLTSVRDAFAIPARGLFVKTSQLRDGFAMRARRTCGPVVSDLLYIGERPAFSWGAGFYHRGPFGYSYKTPGQETEMFMGSTATLILQPTRCEPTPLLFRADIGTAGPATLVVNFLKHTERLFITSNAPLVIRTPKSRFGVRITLSTDAPVAEWDPTYFRYDRDRPRGLRLRFSSASISEDAVAGSLRHGAQR